MKQIANDRKITKSGNHVETLVDDEIVLMHIDSGKFFSLSETSRRMWELLGEHDTLPSLVDAMAAEYEVKRGQCEAELTSVLLDLQERTLVTVS
ncbi:MAG: PqqD family protein [Sphingomonadaceae bacterium]|nr:PqqD family protein [Sphingomonadaceae bacterium]